MQYIINDKSIVFFFEGKPLKIAKTDPCYHRIIACFDLPEDQQEDSINNIIQQKVGQFTKDGFTINPVEVTFEGERLPTALANKVRSISAEGLPVKLFAKFWENLQANPSANSVRELYDFLAYKELPITEDGCFIAYKGVQRNGYSCSGNLKTKVLQGIVDSAGKIENNIGDTIEVLRRDVDDNRGNGCSYGLHVGSLEYAESFSQGKLLIVKINPADVVSVPQDCSCQKCRVAKYQILDAYETEITNAVTDEDGNPIMSEEDEEHDEFVGRIEMYLIKKGNTHDVVSIRSIQNSFSPEYPSRVRVLDALNELGVAWGENRGGFAGGWSDTII